MTVLPQGSEISRRRLLQFGAAAGFLLGTGTLAGCAGPTGLPGPSTLTLALNRSLVSLDNKLNQFDAAVTVQRAVRQGLTAIGPETKPDPGPGRKLRNDLAHRSGPSGSARASSTPTARRCRSRTSPRP